MVLRVHALVWVTVTRCSLALFGSVERVSVTGRHWLTQRRALRLCGAAFCAAAFYALPVRAQVPPVPAQAGGAPQGCSLSGLSATPGSPGFQSNQWHLEQLSATHWKLTGQVEVEC